METIPVFPLGSVLFPGMPVALRIFEERFLVLLSRVLDGSGEFGVVLIERGSEVGGGDARFPVGTVARLTRCDLRDGHVAVMAVGGRRFEVVEWLEDDPHPLARVRYLPPLAWSGELLPLRDAAEVAVRRTLRRAGEYSPLPWPADVLLADDPVIATWQLAGISPLGPLDHVRLLRATSTRELLELLTGLTEAIEETIDVAGAGGLWGTDRLPLSGQLQPDEDEDP